MNLSKSQNDATKSLNNSVPPATTTSALSGNTNLPEAYGSETDPVFSSWDKHTGITIHQSQIIADAADITPTGLAATPIAIIAGSYIASISLTWDAIVTSTFDHYVIRYRANATGDYTYVNVSTNLYLLSGLIPNTSYAIGIASVNKSGIFSAYTTDINSTTLLDTVAPATVTGVSATASYNSVILKWTANTDVDIASYNIYRSGTSGGTKVIIANINGTYFTDYGLTGGVIEHYWIKGKDTSGNLSVAYSTEVSATPTAGLDQAGLEALLGMSINDIATINPSTGHVSSNTVGTLVLDDNSITESKILTGAITRTKLDIVAINPANGTINYNQVGTLQIATGAVNEFKIAGDAIRANHLATDSVTGNAIMAGEITAGKIGVGAVTADKILAGAVTANKITSFNFYVSAGSFTDSLLVTSWIGCKVVYTSPSDNVYHEYTITDGSVAVSNVIPYMNIYWELSSPTVFSTSASLPLLTNDDFLVASVKTESPFTTATHLLVWNSTIVDGNRITTGSISATNMAANSIMANAIATDAVTAIKIQAGAVTANKIKSYNFMLNAPSDGAVWTNNTPTSAVTWSGVTVTYDGVTYPIDDDYCSSSDVYIYWVNGATTFSRSSILPTLGVGDFIVGTNGNTYYPKGTMFFLNAGTIIDGNTISTGSITTGLIAAGAITANKIETGTITATQIASRTIVAENIKTGEIEADHFSATAANFFVATDGGTYSSSPSNPHVKIFPTTDIGIQVTDAGGSNVFLAEVGGTNIGDVTIGNYSGNHGILYDASAGGGVGETYFKGSITAPLGLIGGWIIDANSIYSGTKVTGDAYTSALGDITIKSDGSIHALNFYINSSGVCSFTATNSTINSLSLKVIEIGIWNMDADATVSVAHGLDYTKIRNISIIIISDAGNRTEIGNGGNANWGFNGTDIVMTRAASSGTYPVGAYDSVSFDDSAMNRGYITIQYVL